MMSLQEKMAKTMEKGGLAWGFLSHTKFIGKKPNLASGNLNLRAEFLDFIKKAIPQLNV